MAKEADDIRRNTPNITANAANTFVRPGVQNDALSSLIGGVGGSILELDAALAKERLGKDLDAARSGFIEGEVRDLAGEDSELQAQLEKELAPFQRSMERLSNAEQQGLLRGDRFMMQADAILQSHIAKRPGLGPEFRQIHAQYTGGAIIETIMRKEQEEFDAAMRLSGDNAKQKEDRKMFQLGVMKDSGFAAEAGALIYGTPEEVNAEYMKLLPQIHRMESTVARAKSLKAAAEGMEAGYQLDRPQAFETWSADRDVALEGVAKTMREDRTKLASADEETFAGMVGQWQMALARAKSRLEADRVRLGLKPEDVAQSMAIFKDMEEKAMAVMDGTIALEERKRRVETFGLNVEFALQQNQPMIASLGSLEKKGMHNLSKWMAENNPALTRQMAEEFQSFVVEGGGQPKEIGAMAAGMTQNLMKDMFPQGKATKNPYLDYNSGVKMLSDFGKAFIVMPTDEMKVKPYREWIEEVNAFREPMNKLFDAAQKKDLAEVIRLASHKVLRVSYLSLLKQHPQLSGKLSWNPDAGDEPFVVRGVDPDGVEARVVDQANQQMGYRASIQLLQILGGYASEQDAHTAILKSAEEVQGQMNLYQSEQFVRRQKEGGPAGTRGAPVRWWEQ